MMNDNAEAKRERMRIINQESRQEARIFYSSQSKKTGWKGNYEQRE